MITRTATQCQVLVRFLVAAFLLISGCAGSNASISNAPIPSMPNPPALASPATRVITPEVGYVGATLKVDPHGDSEGVNLVVTPTKVVGRIVRPPSYDVDGQLTVPESKFYIAVRLSIQNTGTIPWNQAQGDPSVDPSFNVFPEDPTVDARWVRPQYPACLIHDGSMLLAWEKKPKLPRRIDPGDSASGWLTFCVKFTDSRQRQLERQDVIGDYVLSVNGLSAVLIGCPIWKFRID